jgi:hypothetical protein
VFQKQVFDNLEQVEIGNDPQNIKLNNILEVLLKHKNNLENSNSLFSERGKNGQTVFGA